MDPVIGEIRMFAGSFAPAGWALCNGQLLKVAQNSVLFAVLGYVYGGDGVTNFALPNIGGRLPIHVSDTSAPGLSVYARGQQGGVTTVTLQPDELAEHGHGLNVSDSQGNQGPGPAAVLAGAATGSIQSGTAAGLYCASAPNVALTTPVMTSIGSGQAHNNVMPYLAVNYIIALQGVFPPRG